MGVDDPVGRLLVARGVTDHDAFLSPSLAGGTPDPSSLANMDDLVARVVGAIEGAQRVVVVGDYDVDGAASSAMVVRLFRAFGHEDVRVVIPHRERDGYGLTPRLVERVLDVSPSLVVCVDNGTGSVAETSALTERGVDVVVLDHHDPSGPVPSVPLVNPRTDPSWTGDSPCAAGLCLLMTAGVRRAMGGRGRDALPHLGPWIGLAAFATVADVVPLTGFNRILASVGLPYGTTVPGIAALAAMAGVDRMDTRTVGWALAPCVNASGRLGDMTDGLELLVTDDGDVAARTAGRLHDLNAERKAMTELAVAEARREAIAHADDPFVVVAGDWHPGLVGLVAGRLRRALDRPVAVIGRGGLGSVRSVPGVDAGSVVTTAVATGALSRGGGHAAAAGLTATDDVEAFRAHAIRSTARVERPHRTVDLALRVADLDVGLYESLARMGPFGPGNPKPRVVVHGVRLHSPRALGSNGHRRMTVSEGDASVPLKVWNADTTRIGAALADVVDRDVDVVGTLELDTYRGACSVYLEPIDVRVAVDRTDLRPAA